MNFQTRLGPRMVSLLLVDVQAVEVHIEHNFRRNEKAHEVEYNTSKHPCVFPKRIV